MTLGVVKGWRASRRSRNLIGQPEAVGDGGGTGPAPLRGSATSQWTLAIREGEGNVSSDTYQARSGKPAAHQDIKTLGHLFCFCDKDSRLSDSQTPKMGSQLASTDAKNKLEDLSGITIQPGQNPYQAFIEACNDDPVRAAPIPLFSQSQTSDGLQGGNPSPLLSPQDEKKWTTERKVPLTGLQGAGH